jgi:hypothetical protein
MGHKSILLLFSLAILLAGCQTHNSQAATSQATSSTPTQAEPASSTPSSGTPSLQGNLLTASIVSDMRVIPSDLDPNTEFLQIIDQYEKATTEDQHLRWFIGAPSGYGVFWLSVDAQLSSPDEVVTLLYPIEVIVAPTEVSAANMNFLAPINGGGGGMVNSFPLLQLQAGVHPLSPDVVETAELKSDLTTGILYEFAFQCVAPGVYNVHINQSYTLNVNGVLSSQMLPYDILFACPLSATTWLFDPVTQQAVTTQGWTYTNGQFQPQPNQTSP